MTEGPDLIMGCWDHKLGSHKLLLLNTSNPAKLKLKLKNFKLLFETFREKKTLTLIFNFLCYSFIFS